jgi:hypothetical protein
LSLAEVPNRMPLTNGMVVYRGINMQDILRITNGGPLIAMRQNDEGNKLVRDDA